MKSFKTHTMPLALLFIVSLFAVSPLIVYGSIYNVYDAAREGDLNEVKELVEQGADVNAEEQYGTTLLNTAVDSKQWEVVKWLVERGVDVNAKDKDGKTVLHYAAKAKQWETVKLLVDHGANVPYPFSWLIFSLCGCTNYSVLFSLMVHDTVFVITLIIVIAIVCVRFYKRRKGRKAKEPEKRRNFIPDGRIAVETFKILESVSIVLTCWIVGKVRFI